MPRNRHPLQIPGDNLEGGGQLLRTATCLSALTGKPIQISRIRGGRPRGGGMKEQHAVAVEFLGRFCEADVEGCSVGSCMVGFWPGRGRGNKNQKSEPLWTSTHLHPADNPPNTPPVPVLTTTLTLENPGSTTLLLQAILPLLLLTPSPNPYLIHLVGGTNVSFSPSIDYVTQVLFPNLQFLGFPPLRLLDSSFRRGWSHGGGRARVVGNASFLIQPLETGQTLPAIRLPRHCGTAVTLRATILASGSARLHLRTVLLRATADWSSDLAISIAVDEDSGDTKRMYLLLVAETSSGMRLGRDWLYDRKISDVEKVAGEMVERVLEGLGRDVVGGRAVDEWMEDQLVVFQGLAPRVGVVVGGENEGEVEREEVERFAPTLHTRTARWLVGELLGVEFDGEGGCEGVGFVAGVGMRGAG